MSEKPTILFDPTQAGMVPESENGFKRKFEAALASYPELAEMREVLEQVPIFRAGLEYVLEKHEVDTELTEKIWRSLATPQMGRSHNEGRYMYSHLALMMEALQKIAGGEVGGIDDKDLQDRFLNNATAPAETGERRIRGDLVEYVFLHDLAKPDTLRVKSGEIEKEIGWDEWQQIKAAGEPHRFTTEDSQELEIDAISYYHAGEERTGDHGFRAAEYLRGKENIDPLVLDTIMRHEDFFEFRKISASTYGRIFGQEGLSEQEIDMLMLVAYLDLYGSLRPNGIREFSNVLNLWASKRSYDLIQAFRQSGKRHRENKLAELMKKDSPVTPEDLRKIDLDAPLAYDVEGFTADLDTLLQNHGLTLEPAQRAQLIEAVQNNPKAVLGIAGPLFGRLSKMVEFKQMLEKNMV